MRLVGKLVEQIEDELDGACDYASCAIEHKSSNPKLARLYYMMANVELEHAMALHEHATEAISDAERSGANPTDEMVSKWEKSHEEMIEKATKVRSCLAML